MIRTTTNVSRLVQLFGLWSFFPGQLLRSQKEAVADPTWVQLTLQGYSQK